MRMSRCPVILASLCAQKQGSEYGFEKCNLAPCLDNLPLWVCERLLSLRDLRDRYAVFVHEPFDKICSRVPGTHERKESLTTQIRYRYRVRRKKHYGSEHPGYCANHQTYKKTPRTQLDTRIVSFFNPTMARIA